MVEKFLVDLFRRTQKQKIAIIIDGTILSDVLTEKLPNLIEKLREIGDIKVAEVIYEAKIPDKDYELLSQVGFTHNVVASNLDLNLLAQTYDLILSDKSIDTLVFGTENENLIPLVTELRKNVTIFALIQNSMSKAFEEAFDGIIEAQKIDEFHFSTGDVSEIETIMGSEFEGQGLDSISSLGSGDTDANISPMSDDLEEQLDLDEELKIQENVNNGKNSSDDDEVENDQTQDAEEDSPESPAKKKKSSKK